MLITDRPRTDFASKSALECDVQIRLLGGARDREIIPLAPGNHSVGSGPKCSLRLRDTGVGPMHCLIARNGEGVRVRRWSNDTLLNGQPFVESALVSGDYLSIGPVDLEIIAPTSFEGVLPLAEPASEVQAVQQCHDLDYVEPTEFDREFAEAESEFNAWPQNTEFVSDDGPTAGEMALARDLELPGIGFEILSALQSQRKQFDELLSRVDELEKKVELALADEPKLSVVTEYSSAATTTTDDIARISPFYTESSLDDDRPRRAEEQLAWTLERADLVSQNADLEADLTTAQRQLADAITELGEAQTTIDELQARLAASQRSCQELSDEQAAYQQQLAELEQQLAAHATRAEEFQEQLNLSIRRADENTAVARAVEEAFDVASEPVWPSAANVDQVANAIDEEPTTYPNRTAPQDASLPAAKPGNDYDWSARPAEEIIESDDASPAETSTDFDDSCTNQTPWPFADGSDATPDDPISAADEAVEALPTNAVATPAKDTGTRLSGDIDEALAHLRELSLWRRVPESTVDFVPVGKEKPVAKETVVAESEAGVPVASPAVESEPVLIERQVEEETASLPATEEPAAEPIAETPLPVAVAPPALATSSYIERYAHMFEGDDRKDEVEPSTANSDLKEILQRGPNREAPRVANVADPATTSSEADDSMEQYMARMMQRIRGDLPSAAASKPAPATEPAENKAGWKPSGDNTSATASVVANKAVAATADCSPPNTEPLISLQELKRKEPTPEFSTDMGALRALANQTARHAIGIHTARTLRRNSLTKLIVSLLAGVTSLYFMLSADDWHSHEFSTGCVALFAAIYWGRLTFLSVIKAVKVGAFDDFDEDFTSVESAKHALPIDVERR